MTAATTRRLRRLQQQLAPLPAATKEQSGPQRRVIAAQAGDTLACIGPDGEVEWSQPIGQCHDLFLLPNGNILTQDGWSHVVEYSPDRSEIVWEWDAKADDPDRAVEIHGFQRLDDGATMLVETSSDGYDCRLLEVEAGSSTVRTEFTLVTKDKNTHADTRNATKTTAGTYLVAHENDGAVREYAADGSGEVIWEFEIPLFGKERENGVDGHGPSAFGNKCYSALRLENGNTLIGGGNGHSILEVSHEKEIVWSIFQHDLPGIVLAWVTQVKRKSNGNTLIVNCHAGPDQPHLIEVNEAKEVVWTWKNWEVFGDAVPVAIVLDA